jgi:radical SAM superfamily enzyme YgiQ (UPF0313 family)
MIGPAGGASLDNPAMLPMQATVPSPIVLATLNAKYIHASLGLRCLLANMDRHGGAGLRAQTQLREFVIGQPATGMVEELLALQPRVIGLGVYIWNVVETTQLVRLLKTLRPDIRIVLGGPEVSHEVEQQEICRLADHVVTGWGDVSFPKLCRALLDGPRPLMKVIAGEQRTYSRRCPTANTRPMTWRSACCMSRPRAAAPSNASSASVRSTRPPGRSISMCSWRRWRRCSDAGHATSSLSTAPST